MLHAYQYSHGRSEIDGIPSCKYSDQDCHARNVAHSHRCSSHSQLRNAPDHLFQRTITLFIRPHRMHAVDRPGCFCTYIHRNSYIAPKIVRTNLRRWQIHTDHAIFVAMDRIACTQCINAVYCYKYSVVCVCLSESLLVTTVSLTKTAKPIYVPFGVVTRVGQRSHVGLLGGGSGPPRGNGKFKGPIMN